MRSLRVVAMIVLLVVSGRRTLSAQSQADLLVRGVNAYQALDYDQAAGALRRALSRDSSLGIPLTPDQRARALTYLGATELFRGRRDSAVVVFRALIQSNPKYRPDELAFPPKVTNLYQEVRRDAKIFTVEAPALSHTHGRLQPFAARLVATSLADVTVTLEREDGTRIRTLYSGPVVDSMTVLWDGLTANGGVPQDGRYALRVAPRGTNGARAVTVPLDIRQIPSDTLSWPSQPSFLPERTTAEPGLRALGAGVLAGVAAVALPSIVSRGVTASSARVAVGVGLSAAGIVGFLSHRPGKDIPENIEANEAKRSAWQHRMAVIRGENAQRRAATQLEIHAGPVSVALLEDAP